jgi:hypothetical protein
VQKADQFEAQWMGENVYRAALEHDFDRLASLSLEAQVKAFSRVSLVGDVSRDFLRNVDRVTASATKTFDTFQLSASSSYDTDHTFKALLQLVVSLVAGPRLENASFHANPQSQYGAAQLRVFFDRNRDGAFDAGDQPLEKANVVLGQRSEVYQTDARGFVTVFGLPTYQAADFQVSLGSIENPFLRPNPKGFRVIPRPGQVEEVALPLVAVGEAEGNVFSGGQAVRGAALELLDGAGKVLKTRKTDREGYYVFEEIPPGKYSLRLASGSVARDFVIPEEGDAVSGLDFQTVSAGL